MNPSITTLVLFHLVFLGGWAAGVELPLLFRLGFDKESVGAEAGGKRSPVEAPGKAEYAVGVVGKGLCLPCDGGPRYEVEGSLRKEEGTISLWLKPVNWNGTCKAGFTFVSFLDEGEKPIGGFGKHHENAALGVSFYLLRPPDADKEETLWLGMGSDGRRLAEWEEGSWHHVALTYAKDRIAVHLDGEQVGCMSGPEAEALWKRLQPVRFFSLGGPYKGTDLRAVVDEVRIYKRALSDEEILEDMQDVLRKYLK